MASKIAYRKAYRMRLVGGGRGVVEATIPWEVVERAARRVGLSVEEFVKRYKIVHLYNDFTAFDGAYRFEPIQEAEELEDVVVE